jgi:hypothetical protein
MNPDTNRLEALIAEVEESPALAALKEQLKTATGRLLRPDGSPVPAHWSTFQIGELVVIKNYTFRVAYIGETAILFEPVGPMVVGTP